ncbi:MAG TPA: threonine synthase [Gemmatimonadaceae bacterium]|nr:threonine synthase [Gemmatimonadaceae bacterium]
MSDASDTPDSPTFRLRCASCGAVYGALDPVTSCAACAGLLAVEHDLTTLRAAELRERFDARAAAIMSVGAPTAGATADVERSGVWRYRELVLPAVPLREVVTYPEGNTPLVHRDAVVAWAGVPGLLLKHEGLNPTGSFKDRGMTVAMTQARRLRGSASVRAVVCASTGNTAASLAAYAAQAGIPAMVLVPEGRVSEGKLAQTLAYGAHVAMVRGSFDECLSLVRRASAELGLYLVNSVNPYRIEGQKTIVLEMLHQMAWEPPEWIVAPAGNLGNASAFWAALRDARAVGLIDRTPRLALVQAEGAAPFARSFATGFRERIRVEPETVASAIRIGDPASYDRAVEAVRSTNGVVLSVSDDEIMEAKRVVDGSGVGCEPASAASVAGVRALVRAGTIGTADRVVAVLTGHLLKDAGASLRWRGGEGANCPVEIEPTMDALARLVEGIVVA